MNWCVLKGLLPSSFWIVSPDFECIFNSIAKSIACNGGGPINISSMLQAPSPQTAYLFLVVTNEMQDSSLPSTAQAVQFDY